MCSSCAAASARATAWSRSSSSRSSSRRWCCSTRSRTVRSTTAISSASTWPGRGATSPDRAATSCSCSARDRRPPATASFAATTRGCAGSASSRTCSRGSIRRRPFTDADGRVHSTLRGRMNKTVCVALASACLVLVPATARADDGGFWDWLFHWDTKFVGYGTEFHVRCWTGDGKKVEHCEEWFGNVPHLFHPSESVHQFTTYEGRQPTRVEFAEIEHEINIRVTYLHSYGQRVPDAKLAADDPLTDDHRTVHGLKLLALYNRRLTGRLRGLEVAGGGGIIPLWG